MARLRVGSLALLLGLAAAAPALARRTAPRTRSPAAPPRRGLEPSHWFASRPGLMRIYEGRARPSDDGLPPAGASCEVLESQPADSLAAGTLREQCTMIVGRKAKPSTELTYEMRKTGIYMVKAKPEGGAAAQAMERLMLPSPLRVGGAWTEAMGPTLLARRVKSAGGACKAAGRSFADCLVLAVVQRQGGKTLRRYSETYAAGVGLVEDAQWELIDVKGL